MHNSGVDSKKVSTLLAKSQVRYTGRQSVEANKSQKSARQRQSHVSRDKKQVYMHYTGLYTCTLTANKIARQR